MGKESVTTSLSNMLQFDLGYAVLNKERVSIYPYAGIALRFSSITYKKRSDPNPNYTSLANMHTDENHVRLESTRLGYQYGVGIDYAFGYNRSKTYKTILFLKAGVNRPFKADKYKSDGIPDYQPHIKQGDWLLTVGFKFATKR